MTEQSASAEALRFAARHSADEITIYEMALDIDALCEQRVSAERERLVNACGWAIHDIGLPPGENNLQIRGMIIYAVADAIRAPAERPAPPAVADYTERAHALANEMARHIIGENDPGGVEEACQKCETIALRTISDVASEYQAAVLMRLREPEMQEAVTTAIRDGCFTVEEDMADAALAVIAARLT